MSGGRNPWAVEPGPAVRQRRQAQIDFRANAQWRTPPRRTTLGRPRRRRAPDSFAAFAVMIALGAVIVWLM